MSSVIQLDRLHLELLKALDRGGEAGLALGELSVELGIKPDPLKKRLTALRLMGLVQALESGGKQYRIDPFCLRSNWTPPYVEVDWPDDALSEPPENVPLAMRDWLLGGQTTDELFEASLAPVPRSARRKVRY